MLTAALAGTLSTTVNAALRFVDKAENGRGEGYGGPSGVSAVVDNADGNSVGDPPIPDSEPTPVTQDGMSERKGTHETVGCR